MSNPVQCYRGRLAPSPTGYLHLGHAQTFWIAQLRALQAGGTLVLRNDDLDRARCKPEFVQAMLEDMRWFGFQWSEGPDVGGPFAPYNQSQRQNLYIQAFETLRNAGYIYPCTCSRQDVLRALSAPHTTDDEPRYPGTCRNNDPNSLTRPRQNVSWRFRVPDGRKIHYTDLAKGDQCQTAGEHFSDFLVWRKDDLPSYQLACVVDDLAMGITEVVRCQDLIGSTFRQILLYEAFAKDPPAFYHTPIMTNALGVRLAKRDNALSLRTMASQGVSPEKLRESFNLSTYPGVL